MSNSPSITGRVIFRAVSSSLELVKGSSGLLTVSQLVALKRELENTLATVDGRLQAKLSGSFVENLLDCFTTDTYFTEGQKLHIDLSDWATSDEDENSDGNAPSCGYPLIPDSGHLPHENFSSQAR